VVHQIGEHMKTQENNIKVYYGLKWKEFKQITKDKYCRLRENSRLKFVSNAITYYPCDSEDKEFYVLLDKNNRVLRYFYVKQELYRVYLQDNQGEFLIYENEPIYTPTHQCYMFADKFYKGLCIMIDGERLTVDHISLVNTEENR